MVEGIVAKPQVAGFMDAGTPGPNISTRVKLRMMGDWGIGTLHRICGWLGAEMGLRTGANSEFTVSNGDAGIGSIVAVLNGDVDIAMIVPAALARTVAEGRALSTRLDVDRLRALATLPQSDFMVLAVDAELGLKTLADVRAAMGSLRLSTAWDNGSNPCGFVAHRILDAAGISKEAIVSAGGAVLEGEAPWDIIPRFTSGEANALLFEAVMTHFWKQAATSRPLNFIPLDDSTLAELERLYGWERGTVPDNRFPNQQVAFRTLDFSDFLMICRDDLPADIAELAAWCVCETRATLESQFLHIPPENSPLTYPLLPSKIATTALPLHDGAKRYYVREGLCDQIRSGSD